MATKKPEVEACGSCRFWRPREQLPEVVPPTMEGECRARAPAPFRALESGPPTRVAWPRCMAVEWCGEWEARK